MDINKGLDIIIHEIRAARLELAEANAAAARREKKPKRPPCTCGAYPFPHRPRGGACEHFETRPTSLVSYHHTRQAMLDAGHKESDF